MQSRIQFKQINLNDTSNTCTYCANTKWLKKQLCGLINFRVNVRDGSLDTDNQNLWVHECIKLIWGCWVYIVK